MPEVRVENRITPGYHQMHEANEGHDEAPNSIINLIKPPSWTISERDSPRALYKGGDFCALRAHRVHVECSHLGAVARWDRDRTTVGISVERGGSCPTNYRQDSSIIQGSWCTLEYTLPYRSGRARWSLDNPAFAPCFSMHAFAINVAIRKSAFPAFVSTPVSTHGTYHTWGIR